MRVYEYAKKHDVSSEDVLGLLRDADFSVKSHMSSVTPEMIEFLDGKLGKGKASSKKTAVKKQEIETGKKKAAKKKTQAKKAPEKKQAEKKPPEKKAAGKKVAEKKAAPKGAVKAQGKRKPEDRKAKDRGLPESKDAKKKAGRSILPERFRSSGPGSAPHAPSADKRKPRGRARPKRKKVDETAVKESIKRTLAKLEAGPRPRKRRRVQSQEAGAEAPGATRVPDLATVGELAHHFGVEPTEMIAKAMGLGAMVTINQRLDRDMIELLAAEYEIEVEFQSEYGDEVFAEGTPDPDNLQVRPPVVVIMGHVDHGKTSLLDRIRKSNIISGESGGITQHIGAYEVETSHGRIVFLDTPGHEAFTAMRARGAQVTDLVVIVVAANDGVMPQSIEAINHAKAADVPIIIAINKIDLPAADPERVKQDLMKHNIVVDSYGGNVTAVEVSAKTGDGVSKLMELIAIEAELLELKADPAAPVRGVVVESKKEEGRGTLFTILVQQGSLRIGDIFVAGRYSGRVRAMFGDRGKRIDSAGPSTPAQVLGAEGVPQAGDTFMVVKDEKQARDISVKRRQIQRERDLRGARRVTLEDLHSLREAGKIEELRIIIKADTDGSAEVLSESFQKLSTDDIKVEILHSGVGAISESDILLASASNAVVIGFHVRPHPKIRELAKREQVDVRFYSVIYEAIDEVKKAMESRLEPELIEEVTGNAEIRETFQIPKIGTIAGCMVVDGSIIRNSPVRVLRDQVVIYEGTVSSLRRFKEDVREVANGFECGIGVEGYDDVKVGDLLETFKVVEKAKTL